MDPMTSTANRRRIGAMLAVAVLLFFGSASQAAGPSDTLTKEDIVKVEIDAGGEYTIFVDGDRTITLGTENQ